MFTKREYREAIENLKLGMTQLQPDGRSCVICEDSGHQAWECHHNPLFMANQVWALQMQWRCFHCNQVFIDEKEAKEHFGSVDSDRPKCFKATQ